MNSRENDDTSVTSHLVEHEDLHFTHNRVKIAILGEAGTGKSSLVRRFKWDVFIDDAPEHEPHQVFTRLIFGKTNKIELVECDAESLLVDDSIEESERKKYRNIKDWVDLNGVLVIYDTTQEGSFDKAIDYTRIMARALPPTCEIALVGTKCDLKDTRKTSFKHADSVAESMGLSLFEVSAKTAINCTVCVEEMLERIVDRRGDTVESYVTDSVYPTERSSSPEPVERRFLPSILCFNWFSRSA